MSAQAPRALADGLDFRLFGLGAFCPITEDVELSSWRTWCIDLLLLGLAL